MRKVSPIGAISLLIAATASAEKGWIEARSEHFTVLTDAGKGKGRDVLYDLEQLRRLVTEALPAQPVDSHVPAAIYAFQNEKSFRSFQPLHEGKPEDWAAVFRPMGFKDFIALRAEGSREAVRELVFSQYMNLVLSYTSIDYPLWLRNGLSLFYGNAYVGKEHADIGKIHPRHRRELGEFRSMPLQDLFAVDRASPWYRDTARRALFDAQSWALVHYLIIGRDAEGRQAVNRFLDLLAEGNDELMAFQQAVSMPLPEIESEVGNYIRKSISQYLKVNLAPLDLEKDFRMLELAPAAADARLGELLIASDRREEAIARLRASIAADPAPPEAYEAMGFLHVLARDPEKARSFLDQAVAKGSANPMVHFQHAAILLDAYRGPVEGIPDPVRASGKSSLSKTLESAPTHADAARLYGFVSLFGEPQELQDGVEVVTRALEAHRGHTQLLFILGQLYARQGNLPTARTIFESLLQRKLGPEMVANIRRQLDFVNARMEEPR